jgi:hypothetical protein
LLEVLTSNRQQVATKSNTETSDLKHRELHYALVSGHHKVQIENQMDELIYLYELRNNQL